MRLHGPICAQGTCLDVLCSPDLPAAGAVVEGPLPPRQNPQRSFAAANVRKCSSAEHPPPPSLRPHSAARPLAVATLATPDASEDWRRGYPPGFPRARRAARSFRDHHLGRRPPGQAHPACLRAPAPPARACPRVSLCTSSLLGPRRHLTYPAAQGPGLGQGAWITSGWDAPLRPAGPALSGIYLAAKLSVPLAPLALLPPPRPLLLSCLSALFSGLITFRIKAKPSPGCEYNAPPSPLGEERGAGAPRGGRGRDRARRAARRRRGGLPGGGPGPPPQRLLWRRWDRCRGMRPCLVRPIPAAGVRSGKEAWG